MLKKEFVEVDDAMFQGVERLCELIFCILGINKIDLDKFSYDVLKRPMGIRTHNLPSGRLKIRLW
jgi:hypothetical protein